ncbi:MAG TPA: ACP S-malonyltransferase [Actinomycetota bacterium]|nr:ACP S-malonyltransferase [Actinomycetota bacterium]
MSNTSTSGTAWMFPGQGSQTEGMLSGLSAAQPLLKEAVRILGPSAQRLTEPRQMTWSTDLVQTAVYIAGAGAANALKSRGVTPSAVLGHSLGEVSALVAADVVDPLDGLRLVFERGKAMTIAGKKTPGGMAAVIGLDSEVVAGICESIGQVWVVNYNSPDQLVIAGSEKSLAAAAEKCLHLGAVKVKRLAVPVAAHTPLMEPAVESFAKVVEQVEFSPPACTLYSAVHAAPNADPDEIKQNIVTAITSPVRFHQTAESVISSGINNFIEVGPGRALTRIIGRTFTDTTVTTAGTDSDAERIANEQTDRPLEVAR